MAKLKLATYVFRHKKKNPGVHSKNDSSGKSGYKKMYRGQGR